EPALDAPAATAGPREALESVTLTLEGRPLRRRMTLRLDALIDAITPLSLEAPIAADLALTHLPPTRRAGSKPFMIEGRNADSGEWESPAPGQRYAEFQAGVQLANRAGALNEIEYSEFVQKVERFADGIGARADLPDMLEVVARARELDAFAGQHDAQLAVRLVGRGVAWSVGYLQQQAGRHGFVPGVVPGRLILPAADEDGAAVAPPVLTLEFDPQAALVDDPNRAPLRTAMLAFDVPQTPAEAKPFARWSALARALADDLDADLLDDRGQALAEASFAAIERELEQLYAALAARDLAAGSAAARRLFA
ncbi:MAG TPA: cell division protein FtsZ, partial [Ideonella sp.]|nr:cell division protein FtsZ [Ideonella sp.]